MSERERSERERVRPGIYDAVAETPTGHLHRAITLEKFFSLIGEAFQGVYKL